MMISFITKLADVTTCNLKTGNILIFPHWYEFLQGVNDGAGGCIPKITALSDIWLIVAAAIDILLSLIHI